MVSCDFPRVIKISDKIDVGPLETLEKWSVFWEQWTDINQVCNGYQWANICMRVLASQRSSKPNSRCIIYYFSRFFLTDKTLYNPLSLPEIQKSWGSLRCVIRFSIHIWSTFLITMLFFQGVKKVVVKNFRLLSGKHQCRSLFLNKDSLKLQTYSYIY